MSQTWPDLPSRFRPDESIRRCLDYIYWISREMRHLGYHSGPERDHWSRRVQRAYAAMFLPMLKGYGDPYPLDVPPAQNPGIWPDVPAATIPGMTLRHQLTVLAILADQLRSRVWPHARGPETDLWNERISKAREALDHGPEVPLPEEAHSEPSAEALEAARAHDQALKDKARQRAAELRRQLREQSKRKKAAKAAKKKTKAAAKKTVKKKTVKKKTKKVAKKTVKKKTAKKKAPKKSTKRKAAKKAVKKKKTAKKTSKKKR